MNRLQQADVILHAGDLSGSSFFDELCALGPEVRAVHGNADDLSLREQLPSELVIELSSARVGVLHDAGPRAGREQRLRLRFPTCDAIIYGHTHLPQITRYDGAWVFNPGSPTERRRGPFHSMLLLTIGSTGAISPELVRLGNHSV